MSAAIDPIPARLGRRRRARGAERGQAGVELVVVVPLLLGIGLLLAQLVVAGWALVSAGEAARAGARASHVGSHPESAAARALPRPLEGAAITSDGAIVRVEVEAPALLPGLPAIPLSAAAALDPGAAQ